MTDPILQAPKFEDDDTPKHNPPIVPCWMTKREYFAALAMQGLLASISSSDYDAAECAFLSVCNADALIAALEK
jgi:hypothetical protein